SFKSGMIADYIGCIAMRHAPHDFSAIEIDGRQRPIRRFHDRQSLNIQARGGARRRGLGGGIFGRGGGRVLMSLCCAGISSATIAGSKDDLKLLTTDSLDIANIREV